MVHNGNSFLYHYEMQMRMMYVIELRVTERTRFFASQYKITNHLNNKMKKINVHI